MCRSRLHFMRIAATLGLLLVGAGAQAQQIIYSDSLQNNWQNWSWASTNLASTSIVHTGADAISVSSTAAYQALYLHQPATDSTPFGSLTFWINGGPSGGQILQVQGTLSGNPQPPVQIGTPPPNTWVQESIPLSALGVAQQSNFDGFWIQEISGGIPSTYYVDDISLTASPPPSNVNININPGIPVHALDTRLLGLNTAIWDSSIGSSATQGLIGAAGFSILRYPGGSASDGYNWSTDISTGNTFQWQGNTGQFVQLMLGSGATGLITTNYGSGTPQMAAAWVSYFNGSPTNAQVIGVDAQGTNWKTVGFWANLRASSPLGTDDGYNFLRVNHPASLNVQHYEVGNECYGTWEEDEHGQAGSNLTGSQWDAVTYATYAIQFMAAMRAVDPTIKIGCVAEPGQDSSTQSTTVTNPVDNSKHSGWTAVLLSTLASGSVNPNHIYPNFIIDHRYPQAPGSESDAGLLSSTTGWTSDANDLRTQLNDYLGSPGAAIELDATETNDVYGNPGKQSLSLVDALYAVDSIGTLSQTEFNDLNWWDMRNGSDASQNNSASLYGWRLYGDYGLISSPGAPDPANTPYPAYYAFKLGSHFVTQGAVSVSSTSSYNLLTAYGVTQADGSVAVLVVNKSPNSPLNGIISLAGTIPGTTATAYSYGKANDLANGDLTVTPITGVTFPFTFTFAPYSMTVIDFHASSAPPTGLTAAGNPGGITLSWSAPSGPAPSSYNVYRSATTGGPYTKITSGVTSLQFIDSATIIGNGNTYYYVVTAVTGGVETGNSNEASASEPAPVPNVPTSLTATASDGGSTLNWLAPSTGPTPTSYKVYRSTTTGGPYTLLQSGITGLTLGDSGLTDGTTYYYVVTALNHTTESQYSNQAAATPTAGTPNAPTGLTAAPGNASVTLAWTASTGSPVPTGYDVFRGTTTGGPYTQIATNSAGVTYLDSALTNGTTYYYVVTAVKNSNQSTRSNQATGTPNWPAPNAPTGLNGTAGNASVVLTWVAPTGTVVPTGYDVFRGTVSGGPYTQVATNSSGVTYSDSGLTNGTAYFYVVTAVNHSVQSADSNQATSTPQGLGPPAPSGLSAVPGNNQVTLLWTAPTGAVKSYTVLRGTTNGGPYSSSFSTGSTLTTNTIKGLSNNTTYYFVVEAVNTQGTSPYSNQASATPNPPVPMAPTSLAAVAGNGTVALTWTAPSNTNPASYNVQRATVSGGPYTTIGTTAAKNYTDKTAANGTTYYYVVDGVNTGGTGPNSNEASAMPVLPIPGIPVNVKATAGSLKVNLSWTVPAGGVLVTSYHLKRSMLTGGPYTTVATVTGTAFSNLGLSAGTTYFYVVSALNTSGEGLNSAEVSATPTP